MIPQNFADAFARVKEVVSIFSQNEERYLSPGYSEAQARLDFIDKLDAKQQLAAAQMERAKTFYENKCAALDRQIEPADHDRL